MGGIAVKKGNSTISYTGTEYQFDAGEKHLYIRTGLGANDIISYPLTTETSASQYCNLAFKVGDQTCYIAKKELRNLVFNTLPTENVSSTNSNTQAVYLDSQTYIDSNNGFATTTYNRYSTQTNYSLRNSANQTYTSTNFIINTEGITNSSSQTYTIQQIASQFLTSTSNSSATSYRTDDTWPGMSIYSSTTYYLSYDTAKNWYYTTSRSNYTSTYVNNTGYGTTTSSSKSTAYLMQNSYQTSYAGSTASGNVLHFWAYDTSMYTHSNGYVSTASDARTSVLTNNSDYNYLKDLSAQGGATYSVYGNFTGAYRVDDWVEEPTGGIGQTYYSGNIASGTSQFENYSVRRTTYYGTSLYNSTVGSTSVSCKVTKTSYGTQRDGYPSGATSMGRTTGQVQTGYTAGYYSTWSGSKRTVYNGTWGYVQDDWYATGQTSGLSYIKSSTYSRSATYTTEQIQNSTKSSTKSPPNYGYGAMPRTTQTVTQTVTHTDWIRGLDEYEVSKMSEKCSYSTLRGYSSSTQWNAKVNSKSYTAKANIKKSTQTYGTTSSTTSSVYYTVTGKTSDQSWVPAKYAYSTSSSYSYSSTYTQEGSVSTGRTVRDRTYLVFTSASTYSSSAPAYQRVTYQTVWYSNNLSSQVDYQTSSIQTYYSYQSRYTQTSSTKYSSYSNRTYYISSTNFTFTKTTSSHNANI